MCTTENQGVMYLYHISYSTVVMYSRDCGDLGFFSKNTTQNQPHFPSQQLGSIG